MDATLIPQAESGAPQPWLCFTRMRDGTPLVGVRIEGEGDSGPFESFDTMQDQWEGQIPDLLKGARRMMASA